MNIACELKNYFSETQRDRELEGVSLFIIKGNGVIVYSDTDKAVDGQTTGALLAGAWQAVYSLFGEQEQQKFRFSFETSSRGVHVLSFSLDQEVFYLVGLFANQLNSGRMKMKLRKIRDALTEIGVEEESVEEDSGLLFDSISEDEINKLFRFG